MGYVERRNALIGEAQKIASRRTREFMRQNVGEYFRDEAGHPYVKKATTNVRSGSEATYNHYIQSQFFHEEMERLVKLHRIKEEPR